MFKRITAIIAALLCASILVACTENSAEKSAASETSMLVQTATKGDNAPLSSDADDTGVKLFHSSRRDADVYQTAEEPAALAVPADEAASDNNENNQQIDSENKNQGVDNNTNENITSGNENPTRKPNDENTKPPAKPGGHWETVHHPAKYKTIHHPAEYKTIHHPAEYKTVYHPAEYKTVHHEELRCYCGKLFKNFAAWEMHADAALDGGDYSNTHGGYTVKVWNDMEQTKAAWDEQVETKAAWDEQVETKAAWDEQVLVKAAWDETVWVENK